MFFIPLSHAESVQLVVHALRTAGGEADCSSCPATRVCMKQCLTISDAVQTMLDEGTLPMAGEPELALQPELEPAPPEPEALPRGSHLKVIK